MPLSEEELRLLEQMERALVEEDPKFASTLRGTSLRRSARRRAILAGVVFLVGVTILMTGAITQMPIVGIAGFVVETVHGVRVFADLVPGSLLDLEPGSTAALVELERAVSGRAEYLPLAAQLHLTAR